MNLRLQQARSIDHNKFKDAAGPYNAALFVVGSKVLSAPNSTRETLEIVVSPAPRNGAGIPGRGVDPSLCVDSTPNTFQIVRKPSLSHYKPFLVHCISVVAPCGGWSGCNGVVTTGSGAAVRR